MTGEDENVMKISSYEDGDWISNCFDNRASAEQKRKDAVFHQRLLQRKVCLRKISNHKTTPR